MLANFYGVGVCVIKEDVKTKNASIVVIEPREDKTERKVFLLNTGSGSSSHYDALIEGDKSVTSLFHAMKTVCPLPQRKKAKPTSNYTPSQILTDSPILDNIMTKHAVTKSRKIPAVRKRPPPTQTKPPKHQAKAPKSSAQSPTLADWTCPFCNDLFSLNRKSEEWQCCEGVPCIELSAEDQTWCHTDCAPEHTFICDKCEQPE